MTRIALRLMIGSVAVASLLGIFAVLSGAGHTTIRVLATSVTITGMSALALACLPAVELPSARPLAWIGIASALLGGALLVAGVWAERDGDTYWQLTLTLIVLACAGAHASLLWQVKLAPKFSWVRTAAISCGVMVTSVIIAVFWEQSSSTAIEQLGAVLGIATGGLSLAVLALGYVSRSMAPADGIDEVCFCPRCGKRLWVAAGEVRCVHCGEAFFIELREVRDLPAAIARKT